MEATLKYAEHKLDEAIRQGEPDIDIAYWRGYRDCAKALEKDHFRDSTKMMDHFPDPTKMVPLTLEQVREINGWPVWVVASDAKTYQDVTGWCICFSDGVEVPGVESFKWPLGAYGNTWTAYAYPPAHIDREAWKPCNMCGGAKTLYQSTNNTQLFMNTFGGATTLVTECNACPPHADCCMKGVSVNSAFKINFCPECGRPLTKEAWAELEKRLRG